MPFRFGYIILIADTSLRNWNDGPAYIVICGVKKIEIFIVDIKYERRQILWRVGLVD